MPYTFSVVRFHTITVPFWGYTQTIRPPNWAKSNYSTANIADPCSNWAKSNYVDLPLLSDGGKGGILAQARDCEADAIDVYAPTNLRFSSHPCFRNKKNDLIGRRFLCMAERVGFEPTHALTRLADFESAPLGLLGTFPQK